MTKSFRPKEKVDEWWKIRMLIKPKLVNPASKITKVQWHQIKKRIKLVLDEKGYDEALKYAMGYVKRSKV